jgi:hypothetical protein
MRFYSREKKLVISQLHLLLTKEDAKRLHEELKTLMVIPNDYAAIVEGEGLNGELNKELKIRIYNKENIETFDEPIKDIILKGPGNTKY